MNAGKPLFSAAALKLREITSPRWDLKRLENNARSPPRVKFSNRLIWLKSWLDACMTERDAEAAQRLAGRFWCWCL